MKRDKLLLVGNALISIAIVALILYLVDFREVLEILKDINLFLLFLSIVFLFLMDLVMTLRVSIRTRR